MSLRPLRRGAQIVAPDGCPRAAGDLRRRAPQLPQLGRPELRAARGAGGAGVSRVLGGDSSWRERDVGLGVGVRSSSPPVLPTETRQRKRHVLPPPLSPPTPWASAPRRPWPREPEAARRGVGRETLGPVGALLGELLPSKFREFLSRLRAKCTEEQEELQAQTPSAPQHQSGVSEPWQDSPQCPSCQFLPDLRDQLSDFQERLEKILHHQKSTLGPLRSDHSEFPTVRKASPSCGTLDPKAMPTPNTSGEDLGPRRRSCPFWVRFADETLMDSTLRYWERHRAVQQNRTATPPAESVSGPGFGSVGRWLNSLPKAQYPGAKEDYVASSSFWAQPGLPTQELRGQFSKGASLNSSLPFAPRPTAMRLWRDLLGLLGTCNFLEQVGRPPCSWRQKPEPFLPSLVLRTGYFLDRLGVHEEAGLFHTNSWGLRLRVPQFPPPARPPAAAPHRAHTGAMSETFPFPPPRPLRPGLLYLRGPRPHLVDLGELCICRHANPKVPSLRGPTHPAHAGPPLAAEAVTRGR
ncbi:uncharacterized protein C9orf50 homolog [Erethizon dorsatum]